MKGSYLAANESGLLVKRITQSRRLLQKCSLCPRACNVDRLAGQTGLCRIGAAAEIASYGRHYGEESALVGKHGSGTIFFCGCNLGCLFCQNYDISHPEEGDCQPVDDSQLARIMVELQEQGCHNINFVTPTHVVPQILSALPTAIESGLTVPLVYNSGGYDSVQSLRLLEGIVDIYMPDFKFWESATSKRYARAADYPEIARAALTEMQRQVGDLQISSQGLAERGLLVRHLLMPGGGKETKAILGFLAREISVDCYVNIMDQYRPCGKADKYPELMTPVTVEEYQQAMEWAEEYGLTRLDRKDFAGLLQRLLEGK